MPKDLKYRTAASSASPDSSSPSALPSAPSPLPFHTPLLTGATYRQYVEALSNTGPHPLADLFLFLDGIRRGRHHLTRQQLKLLAVSYSARDDLDGTIALMRLMVTEGVGFDADVVNCVMRQVPKQRLDAYLQAMDEQLVQREPDEERRLWMLSQLFQGLCDGYLTAQGVRLIRLMAERGVRVTSKHMTDLLASLDKQSSGYVRQATELISLMLSFSLSPTISYWIQLASNVHSADDASLLLSHLSGSGVPADAALYSALLERLLALPATAVYNALPDLVGSILDQMTQQRVALTETQLLNLHLTAKMRKLMWFARRVWVYMQTLELPIDMRWLLIHAQFAAVKLDATWLTQIAAQLHSTVSARYNARRRSSTPPTATDDGSTSYSASASASSAASWPSGRAVYEELLTVQPQLPDSKQFTFRLWMQMRENGAEEWIEGKGKLYQALLKAVRSRIRTGLTKEELASIRVLLSPVEAEANARVPSCLTAEMVDELNKALRALGEHSGTGTQRRSNGAVQRMEAPMANAPPPADTRSVHAQPQRSEQPQSKHRHTGPPKRIIRSTVSS